MAAGALLLALLLPSACGRRTGYLTDSFLSMDTVITVSLGKDTPDAEKIFAECRRRTEECRVIFDAHDPASALSRLNASAGGMTVPDELADVVSLAARVSEASGGAFDFTLLPVSTLWRNAEARGSLPTGEELAAALALRGAGSVSVVREDGAAVVRKAPGQTLDLGGIGKGAAEMTLLSYLSAESGAPYGVLSFGGNVAVFGEKPDGTPFVIALRDPSDPSGTAAELELSGGEFVSVSGDYERYYEIDGEKYGHILDPETGFPADGGLLSVAVVTHDGALGDALATALFVLGEEKGMALYRSEKLAFEAVFVRDGGLTATPGLAGKIRAAEGFVFDVSAP